MDEFYILENCNLINSKNVCELYLDFCIAITNCDSKNGGNEILKNIEDFLNVKQLFLITNRNYAWFFGKTQNYISDLLKPKKICTFYFKKI